MILSIFTRLASSKEGKEGEGRERKGGKVVHVKTL